MVVFTAEKPGESVATSGKIRSGEAIAYCPHCKALQTVWISEDRLLPTRKFYEKENQVFHDCGSRQPCRLYQDW